MSNCNCHKGTIRDGSGQLSRYLKALDPSYAPIDDRSLEDLLKFMQQYASRIRFYDIPESQINDGIPIAKVSWEAFFKKDMAVIAALVGLTDSVALSRKYEIARQLLEAAPDEEKLSVLFQTSLSIASMIDEWYQLAIAENPLHQDLDLVIHSVLDISLQRIMAYDAGYKLVNPTKPLLLEYGTLDDNELWGTDTAIPPDVSIYVGSNESEKILNAALYADELFNTFLSTLNNILSKSEGYLQFALEQYPNHQPQMTLLLAFLKLFQLAQQEMNGLTERMLDFYYKDVLQLTAKKALPDKVHLVFELAKNVSEYDLKQATQLKGGKDDLGKEQLYETKDDLVINQAKVQELKTVFIEKKISDEGTVLQSIYANPVANSEDGLGKPFAKDGAVPWNTFGAIADEPVMADPICSIVAKMQNDAVVRNVAMPGFAIASPQLVLGGGNRQVIVAADGISQMIAHFEQSGNSNPFTIWLTGEKGWINVTQNATETLKGLLNGDMFSDLEAIKGIEDPVYGFQEADDQTKGIVLFLPVAADAVVPFDAKLHPGYAYNTTQPVMQVMLNPGFEIAEADYNQWTASDIFIKVKVGSINNGQYQPFMDGLKNLILQNDDQILPLGKAFNPFTFLPATGKSFYIGSEEVFNKPISQLSVNIRSTQSDINHSVDLFLLKQKKWLPIYSSNKDGSFRYDDLSTNILESFFQNNENGVLERTPILKFTELNGATLKGFLRLDNRLFAATGAEFSVSLPPQQLLPQYEMKEVSLSYTSELTILESGIDQFFHVYPFGVAEIKLRSGYLKEPVNIGTRNTMQPYLSRFSDGNTTVEAQKFFPRIQENAVSDAIDGRNKLLPQFAFINFYNIQKRREVNLPKMQSANNPSDVAANPNGNAANTETMQLEGRTEISKYYAQFISPDIIGRKINQYFGEIQEEGLLYIGLSDTKPLQSVSMLFQFAEGSAGDEDNDPPKINWSYLSGNQWCPLPGENLIVDGTYGFQTTGILKFTVPKDATNENTIITSGLYWLRASVTENANRIPMLISVVTQAVLAEFADQQNSQNHYAQVLPAGSISKLKDAVSQVSKVIQPFASFDAKPKEVGKEFYVRVSERLRHKHRPITAWDYEHLILDRFPSVYKVKCITHTDPNCLCRKMINPDGTAGDCCGSQIAPGHVLLVPIANLKNRNGVDPLQPKTARRVLIDMVNYIKPLVSPFVKVYAKNPVYEQIIVSFKVKFYSGTDIGFYLKKLNDEIVQYLTPWAFDEHAEVAFGQKVYASSIINFIEERPYVDFITDFLMGICKQGCCDVVEADNNGVDETPVETINSFSNCAAVEASLSKKVEESGYVVAVPSTPRSILVSAPKHVIVPYEAPPEKSPCENRKQQLVGVAVPDVSILMDKKEETILKPQKDLSVSTNISAKDKTSVTITPSSVDTNLELKKVANNTEKKTIAASTDKKETAVGTAKLELKTATNKTEEKPIALSTDKKKVSIDTSKRIVKKAKSTLSERKIKAEVKKAAALPEKRVNKEKKTNKPK